MKYLREFQTRTDYNTAKSTLDLPNVSLITETNGVEYKPFVPPFFAKLTLNNGEIVELEGNGELTNAMISSYGSTLVSAEIGTLCTSIGQHAFGRYSGLTSVTISNSVTSIGNSAFTSCSSLTSIEIPSGVTSIGNSAFTSCSSLTSIVVDSGNTVYDSRNNCNAIIKTETNTLVQGCKTTIIPNSVTSISNSAFYGCSSLTSIEIPSGVTSIGNSAFNSCRGLTSIEIPNSVTSIGNSAFNSCRGLTSIVVDSANTVYDSRNNCNAIINTSTNELIAGCKNTVIPNTVTSIGDDAFRGCNSLTSITIPDSVTSIGSRAFTSCSGLISITSLATTAPAITSSTFQAINTGGTLTVPSGSSGYDVWMGTGYYYLGKCNWTKVEQ